jgi:hypothetical protein
VDATESNLIEWKSFTFENLKPLHSTCVLTRNFLDNREDINMPVERSFLPLVLFDMKKVRKDKSRKEGNALTHSCGFASLRNTGTYIALYELHLI